MPKLTKDYSFLDVSDYGRPVATLVTKKLQFTSITPIQITLVFGLCGLISIFFILTNHFLLAGIFLILKSIIDAMDGELARLKNTPSYVGRYLDSIFDILLNLLIFAAIGYQSGTCWWLAIFAFLCIETQGTLYNYYYVILRNSAKGGDATSNVFETKTPTALHGESQKSVNIIFIIYRILYGVYDKLIYSLDYSAYKVKHFPSWFMTILSFYGLGFQLLIIAVMLGCGLIQFIIPFFIAYSILFVFLIAYRKIAIR